MADPGRASARIWHLLRPVNPPCYAGGMSAQLMLFETESEARPDGSLVVRPKRLCTGQEISAKKAAGMLGFRDVETISNLVALGKIRGWKPESVRGNAKWRIDLQSVLDYKLRRQQECGR